MKKTTATEFINLLQSFYQLQRNNMKLFFRGEESMLLFLYEKTQTEVITPSDLSDELNISTARVATSLNSLENKNYLTREIDKDDRRKIIINLTDEGKKKSIELKENHFVMFNQIISKLGEKDTEELLRIGKRLKTILEEEVALC